MERRDLEGLDREALVVQAQAAGIRRARILTRPELIDELLRLDPLATDASLKKSRGFFGRARDLVARVVERGLHLPDAAERILTGTDVPFAVPRAEPQAMPTVTLAEIYAAQGHRQRALETLQRVLEREPEHTAARALLARLEDKAYVPPPPPLPPEPEIEPDVNAELEAELDAEVDAEIEAERESEAEGLIEAELEAEVEAEAEAQLELEAVTELELEAETLQPETLVTHVAEAGAAEAGAGALSGQVTEPGEASPWDVALPEDEPDECFAIPLPPEDHELGGRTYVRWRVSPAAISAQLEARPNGHFVVRAHVVTPSWDGPTAETRDRMIAPDAGEVTLGGLPVPAVVRVAVGWLDDATFIPFAHSPALEATPGQGLAVWTPLGMRPVMLEDPRGRSLARAIEESRSAASAGS